ncbi:MAG: TIM barrel protein [Aestuariivirga sp.]|uniref:TIM barrel protein n=1 Tax=Aestuariivirga sp. TaxID=2650926 RepID=UPI003017FEA5
MTDKLSFALNQITAPRLTCREFIELARRLDCSGIELRNDLRDKRLCDRDFFDGDSPESVGALVRENGLRLLGLSEVYAFNRWSEEIRVKVDRLIGEAVASGAESISLIPSNDGRTETDDARLDALRNALSRILPMLEGTDLIALVEPLGFPTSSLRRKSDAIAAIKAVDGDARYKLVHDTFHHHLASEREFFPEWTGIVHISGVVDPSVEVRDMQDEHRILVTGQDRLGNLTQIAALSSAGYRGVYSYECFAPSVHHSATIGSEIAESLAFIRVGIS